MLLKSQRIIALAKTYRTDVFSTESRQRDSESFLSVSIATDKDNPDGVVIDPDYGFGFKVTLTDYFPESVESHGFKFGKIVKLQTRVIVHATNDESGRVTVDNSTPSVGSNPNLKALDTLGIDAESASTLIFKFYSRACENKTAKRADKESTTPLMIAYRSQQDSIRKARQ